MTMPGTKLVMKPSLVNAANKPCFFKTTLASSYSTFPYRSMMFKKGKRYHGEVSIEWPNCWMISTCNHSESLYQVNGAAFAKLCRDRGSNRCTLRRKSRIASNFSSFEPSLLR